jgi:hypothetical protein
VVGWFEAATTTTTTTNYSMHAPEKPQVCKANKRTCTCKPVGGLFREEKSGDPFKCNDFGEQQLQSQARRSEGSADGVMYCESVIGAEMGWKGGVTIIRDRRQAVALVC